MDILIAIPAFNEQEDLKKTVETLKSGIGSSFKYKLLLLNDGSTDDTDKICEDISPDYYLESKVNYGLASAFSSILNFSKELDIDYLILLINSLIYYVIWKKMLKNIIIVKNY